MSWNVASKLNPELLRMARVSLPRRRAVFIAGLTLALLAAGGWLLWEKSGPNVYSAGYYYERSEAELLAEQTRDFGRAAFEGLTVLLFALLFVFAPAAAGLSFVYERVRGTAVFQQMTLLSPLRQASGKFWGSGLVAYFVAAMLLPAALSAAYLGETNPNKVLRIYLFLFVGGLCWQAVGLFVSASTADSDEKTLRAGLLAGPVVGLCGGATALALGHYFTVDIEALRGAFEDYPQHSSSSYQYNYYVERGHYWWRFYGATVPAYAVVLGVLAFAGAWAFAGAVRRAKALQLIPTGPRAVWLFFASAEAVVVGLLWGRHVGDHYPSSRVVSYLFLNLLALVCLAAASAVGRGRLSEWWSAARDPVALFQREEIKNAVKTYAVVLGIAEAGLAALWLSYYLHPETGELQSLGFAPGLLAVGATFAAASVGAAAFIQFCAMFRFRVGALAGVALLFVFYVFVTLAGAIFDRPNNTFTLLNPVLYADAVMRGDLYLDSDLNLRDWRADTEGRDCEVRERLVSEWPEPSRPTLEYVNPLDARCRRPESLVYYEERRSPDYDRAEARAHGLVAESLLALFFLGLAGLKWSRTRAEMLGGRAGVAAD